MASHMTQHRRARGTWHRWHGAGGIASVGQALSYYNCAAPEPVAVPARAWHCCPQGSCRT
eukprot:724518-Lingulodinium_polyedra.AAC.1